MIKLIAIDMDGTLLSEKKTVEQAQVDALKKAVEKGIKIVLCTGRPLAGVKPIFDTLGLSESEYVIVNNGCSIHRTSDWLLIDWYQLTKQDMVCLNDIVKKEPVQLTLFDETHYFCVGEEPGDLVTYDASLVYLPVTTITIEQATSGEYTMFQGMILGEEEALNLFQQTYEAQLSEKFSVVRSQKYIFETMPKGTTKASALEKLATRLNISKDEIMAIGDGNNDIEMLQYAGVSVAMGNGTQKVKEVAKYETDTNDNNGVAKAIEKYALTT